MGALKEYVMPDGCTYQFADEEVPPEAKLVEQPKEKAAPKARKKADE